MHHHAYLWTGSKARFDDETLRRPPHPDPPPAGSRPELIERYRLVAAEFRTSDLPPLETAYWLVKPRTLVRGTWDEAKEAADWLGERLAEYAPRFAAEHDRGPVRLARLVEAAAERLRAGGDVSYGRYLERPSYLALAVVTCSPNHAVPELPCPCA
ncbi:hypothetical protein ROS62_12765 [Streptomyces sp. DSM 41972]|uniref:Replication initiator protein n=1 Tax=Streptomyces althioticus subsp. attaecolombicae TaxID=3075534 RepID=A0ABU3HZL5_9ACTN|nr:hypothetical protein [Streptomyces sp. DSM 41972]SCE02914.1 hypothetical protein GA0115238_142726 [Streptomyces sp. di50b]SCE45148.1 hypothetical protein GA0115245_138542 [Streptomyces sp. di188]